QTGLRRAFRVNLQIRPGSQRGPAAAPCGSPIRALSLSQSAKRIAVLPHELTSGLKLLLNVRIVRRQQDAVRRLHSKERVALLHPEFRQQFLGKDSTRGGADRDQLHTQFGDMVLPVIHAALYAGRTGAPAASNRFALCHTNSYYNAVSRGLAVLVATS